MKFDHDLPLHDVREEHREVEDGAGEDDRDDAGLVDLERDVGALAAVHPPAHHPLGELDRDAPLALLDEDDGHDHADRQQQEQGEGEVALLGPDVADLGRHAAHHVGEDQDRHAVADAPLGDQLAHPHDDGGAGGDRQHDQGDVGQVEGGDQLQVGVGAGAQEAVVELVGDAGGLEDGEADGHVPGPLGDLLLADRTLLLPLLDPGDDHRQQLHDDRAGDVRHDPEGEDRHLGQGAAGEQVQEAEDAALVGLALQVLDGGEVDAGHGDVRAQPVQEDHEQREQDLVAKIHHLEDVLQAGKHGVLRLVRRLGVKNSGQRLDRALPAAGGRPWPNGSGRTSTVPPAAVIAASADLEKPWADTRSERVSSPRPEHLDQAVLVDQAVGPEGVGADDVALELLEGVEVDDGELDPERVAEALELRHPPAERHLATLEPGLDRAAGVLALGAPAGGLAALAADAPTDPLGAPWSSRAPASDHGPS